jgi:hypothetical protein
MLKAASLREQVMIDVSHANSSKQHQRQVHVAAEVAAEIAAGDRRITGVMIESHLEEGRQDIVTGQPLKHGVSVTGRLHQPGADGAGAAGAGGGGAAAAQPRQPAHGSLRGWARQRARGPRTSAQRRAVQAATGGLHGLALGGVVAHQHAHQQQAASAGGG